MKYSALCHPVKNCRLTPWDPAGRGHSCPHRSMSLMYSTYTRRLGSLRSTGSTHSIRGQECPRSFWSTSLRGLGAGRRRGFRILWIFHFSLFIEHTFNLPLFLIFVKNYFRFHLWNSLELVKLDSFITYLYSSFYTYLSRIVAWPHEFSQSPSKRQARA